MARVEHAVHGFVRSKDDHGKADTSRAGSGKDRTADGHNDGGRDW